MMSLSYTEIQKIVNEIEEGIYPRLNLSILRNITVEPIEPYLRYFAHNIGFVANVQFGDYDTVLQDAIGGNSAILNEATHCVLVFVKLEGLSSLLTQQFPRLTPEQVEAEMTRIDEYVSMLLQGIRQQTTAMILWMSFELPVNPALGILDRQTPLGQYATIQRLNALAQQTLSKLENAYLIDLNLSIARIGFKNYFDHRYWHIGRSPFTRAALQDIASETFKFIRALKGKVKKCLVLDCDNTLWGGVIGEDGLAGIKLSRSSHPGSSYFEFQQEIVNLYHRGVLIALCSKNNEADVWDVFRNHPDMVLQEEHIAAAQINWSDKASNLCQIAKDLNIGLDSLVFIDDSEFEINLVQQFLPEVESIHLCSKKSTEHRLNLAACGLFDSLALTQEDRDRGAMYLAERQRVQSKTEFVTIEQYNQSLEIVAEFCLADAFAIPRIAQLTQKTNQFNLTTKRYSEADIAEFVARQDADVFYLKLRDKFGDYGIVGVCILLYIDKKALIDTFLLSCRVLGRYAEDALLCQALERVRVRGCEIVWGEYLPTSKNAQVEQFYASLGFAQETASHFYCKISQISNLRESRFIGQVISDLEKR